MQAQCRGARAARERGTAKRVHDDVRPAHEGEECLFLVRIERQPECFDVAQKSLEHGVRAGTLRRQAREERGSFGHGVSYHA